VDPIKSDEQTKKIIWLS